ncbi:MAG: sugar phosphate isomerase/epimerase family protein [Spirochaetota bacterium]
MFLTGITDEAADTIEDQIAVCRELGWRWIDLRTIEGENITNIPEVKFGRLLDALAESEIEVSSFSAAIANWGRRVTDPFDTDFAELERAIPRMHRAGTRFLRIMSYRPEAGEGTARWSESEVEYEVIRRLRELARRAEDGGIVLLHENCDTWGGQSFEHTQRLLEAVDSPAFSLVFDTGNPVETRDCRADATGGRQDAFEFYQAVREHISYVHIKDAYVAAGKTVYTLPGEGDARVEEIVADLRARGYDGGFSIEPHVAVVHHDPSITADPEERRQSFLEYARRTEELLVRAGYAVTGDRADSRRSRT